MPRLFYAVELPAAIQAEAADLISRLEGPGPKVRWVRTEGLHLTLRFLGDVVPERVDEMRLALEAAAGAAAPFTVRVAGLGAFPDWRRPGVIWVGVEEPTGTLARLAADLERRVREMGFASEERVFKAHVTLGRIKERQLAGPLAERARSLGVPVLGEARVEEAVLMESERRSDGARYARRAATRMGS